MISLPRPEMTRRSGEGWRPPPFAPDTGLVSRIATRLRRFLDLQAGSIWGDLTLLLEPCRGALLDVGCGAQPYRPLVSKGASYRGIDRAEMSGHFGYTLPDVEYFTGDQWPVPDGSCDVVLAAETLEHVPDVGQFLSESRRCLRPGGWLLMTIPFAARWHYIPHDYWRFTPSGLARVLGAAGFQDVAVYARGNEATVACYKAMALVLPLLLVNGRNGWHTAVRRLFGLALSPALLLLAAIGNLTLRSRGGDDCLGYTVVARRPEGATS